MNEKIKIGTKIYVFVHGIKLLRTINYISNNIFEWKHGWAYINDIKSNTNKKSKIKYTINN